MKDSINYDDFSKLDIRIGEIVAVEIVPETDKLLKLSVNFGDLGERTIVSGIRQHFEDPQVLVGVQTSFVVNLEPRTLRGIESQGMLFAAGDGNTFSLMLPQNTIATGTPLI